MHVLRRKELPKKIQLHGFSIKEKNKKCKTLAGTHWFLSRDFLKRWQAFPQRSGLCLPPGWFPADTKGAPNQAPGRAQGEGPARHRHAQGHAVPIFLASRPAEKAEQA